MKHGLMCVLLLLVMAPVWACYSGLALIPTADVVCDGEYSVDLQVDGVLDGPAVDTYILNTEVGFGDRFEAGLDYDFSADADPRLLVNAKYVLATNSEGTRALATGVYSLATKGKMTPYVVGTGDLGVARLHLGALRSEEKTRWFVGADRDLSAKINLCADYISGDENDASVALNYQFTPSVGLFGGIIVPNSDGDTLFTLHLVFGGQYRHPKGD